MSRTIDQRVVEMRFDNKHFENNVKQSMSTLDKLKQKLNLNGAAKGLENINTSANKVNMNGLSNALSTVQAKFSALDVIGVTALVNITNSAVNAGKRIASALTIEPIKTGFQEYETQINAIQTILSNTRSEGTNVKIVNEALDELNKYADKTIYNFTEMTKNIGTFTAAGVKLDTSVNAIKGIANLAAVSGSTSQQASTAMYQLSQALAAGKVSLMDWNSVVNAGMGGKVFQDALIRTSELMGTGAQAAIDMHGSFRESLTSTGWLTTEVLTETLNQLSGAYDKADLIAQGFTESQAEEIMALAKDAENAATKVKTFTQLWDVLKESAQSGWSKTWRLIIGDFEDAKNLLSPLAAFLTGAIDKFSEARNTLLESALGKSFTGLLDKIKTSADGVKKVVDSVKDYAGIVDEIIGGKWGNGQDRWTKLAEAGYDWAYAQNLVNEKLGNSVRHATDYKEIQNGVSKTQEKVNKTTTDYIVKLTKLSDAELKAKGYTKDQIAAFRELADAADKTGIPLKEFIDNIDDIDGRYLLMNSFKNIGLSLVSVFKSLGTAWRDAFPPMASDTLFNMIAGLHKFSAVIRTKVEKNADKLTRTLKGLFAIIDIITTFVGGGLKIAFTILKTILGAFNLDILEFTALIGDGIVKVRDWIEENNLLAKGIKKITPYIKTIVTAVKDWIANNEVIAAGIEKFKSKLESMTKSFNNWFEGLKETDNIPKYIIQGLVNGLKNGVGLAVEAMIELGKGILEAIKGVLGIHSPSTEFFEIGKNIIQGLINGLQNGLSGLWNFLKNIGSTCVEIFNKIDFGKIFAAGMGIGILFVVKNLIDTIQSIANVADKFAAPLEGLGNLLTDLGDGIVNFSKGYKAAKKGEAIRNIALAIGILAASVYLLSKIKPGTLWATIGAIAALAAIIGVLALAASKMDDIGDFGKSSLSLLGITGALFILATTLSKLSKIDPSKMGTIIAGFTAMIIGLSTLFFVFGTFVKGKSAENIHKASKMLSKIGVALLLMSISIKIISGLGTGDILKGISVIGALGLMIAGLIALSKFSGGNADKAGKMISKIAFALLITIGVIKLASMLEAGEIFKGFTVITLLGGFFAALMYVSKFAGKNALKAGGMMLMMSLALATTVGVIKLIGTMSSNEIIKAFPVITLLGAFFAALVGVSHFAGKHAIKAGAMLLMVSGALLILTGVLFILSKMDGEGLYKALGIVTVLEILFGGLIYVTRYATDCMKSIIAITIAITLLTAIVIGLSFMDPSKLAKTVASMSALMISLAAVIASTKLLGQPGTIMKSLLPMVGIIGILAGVIALLASINADSAIKSSVAISTLLLSMTVSLLIARVMGPLATKGIGALVLMTLVVGGLAAILGIMDRLNVETSMETAKALSTLLLAMSASLVVLGVVGLLGPAAFIGIGALATLIVALGTVITAIGALYTKFPMLEEFLDKGIPILEKIGYGLGAFVGNIVGGFMSGVANGLPNIGLMLSQFMINAMPFITGAKLVDKKVLTGIGILTGAILALTAAELINRVTSFISGGTSFATLGSELSMFMLNAMPFITMSKQIDPSIMKGVKTLAEAISILTGANLLQSLTSWITGDKSLADFGEQLGGLGTSMNEFVTNLGTFTDAQVTTVDCAGKAITSLAKAADQIPNEGGWAGKIAGENSLAKFGDKLPGLATNLKGFVTNLGTFSDAQVTTVDCAGKAIKALAEAANEIPNEGGLWAAIVGDNSLAKFGDKLPGLGTHLNGFISNLGSFDDSKITTVNCACKAIKALASAANEIPNEGGMWAAIVGDNSLATFGNKLPGLGTHISSFVSNLGTFTEAQVTTVNSACKAIKSIAKLGEINIENTGDGLNSFGKNMVKFAKKVKDFIDTIGDVGSKGIDSAITKTTDLVNMAKTVANTDIGAIKTFGDSLKKFAKEGVKGFVKEFSGNTPKKDAKKAVEAMLDSAIKGADDKKPDVEKKFKNIAEAAVNALCTKTLKSNASQAGKDLVTGFVNGINNNTYLATNAGSSIGKAALNAAKRALDSHSPSREAMKVGNWFGQGLVIGIKDYESKTYDAGYGIADYAKEGLSKAISKVSAIINSGIDTQPTIRPVLDLSDIESGAGYLNTMFNNGPSIGVMFNLRAINSSMNSRNQNGSNGDVVSAINKLGRTLGNTGGDTYNINGVSVDDDINVRNAVQTIVRAAKMERRV